MPAPKAQMHSTGLGYLMWIFGFIGIHCCYYGKPVTGVLWLLTGGHFGLGWIYDFCTLNEQMDERNRAVG